MDLAKEIRELESKGVFIHIGHDHYKDGSNCIWSIQFTKFDNRNNQTGWFGDNHEFGDTVDCYAVAIKMAKKLLEDDNLKWYFFNVTETVTEEGRANFIKSNEINTKIHEVVFGSEG